MADAKVPGIGGVNKPTLYIAGAAGLAAVGYAMWKKKKADAAAAATPAASAYGYGAYGYAYGATAEDLALEDALASGYAYGGYGYAGIGGFGVGTSLPPVSTLQPVATNAEWAQYAQSFLVQQGYDAQTVANALGAYITGANVGANEGIVQAAIAFEGYPPIAGANGHPPSINTNGPNTGQTSTTTASKSAGAISNLQPSRKTATSFTVGWNPATGATGGYAYVTTGGGVNKTGKTTGHSVTVTGLKKGTTYNFAVQALPGGPGDNIHITL